MSSPHWYDKLSFITAALLTLAVAALVHFKGKDQQQASDTARAKSQASQAARSQPTQLEVLVWAKGRSQGSPRRQQITCDGEPAARKPPLSLCDQIKQAGLGAFKPRDPTKGCTLEIGGPQEAVIRGRYQGTPINQRYNLRNGCEIARWRALSVVLGPLPQQSSAQSQPLTPPLPSGGGEAIPGARSNQSQP